MPTVTDAYGEDINEKPTFRPVTKQFPSVPQDHPDYSPPYTVPAPSYWQGEGPFSLGGAIPDNFWGFMLLVMGLKR